MSEILNELCMEQKLVLYFTLNLVSLVNETRGHPFYREKNDR